MLTDGYFSYNSNDLSDYVKQITINYESDIQETTTMGATARTFLGGLLNWTATIEFRSDYADNLLDEILYPLLGGSGYAVEFRPTSSSVGASNPKYTGTGIMTSFQPIGGTVGELAMSPISLQGSGVLTRATA